MPKLAIGCTGQENGPSSALMWPTSPTTRRRHLGGMQMQEPLRSGVWAPPVGARKPPRPQCIRGMHRQVRMTTGRVAAHGPQAKPYGVGQVLQLVPPAGAEPKRSEHASFEGGMVSNTCRSDSTRDGAASQHLSEHTLRQPDGMTDRNRNASQHWGYTLARTAHLSGSLVGCTHATSLVCTWGAWAPGAPAQRSRQTRAHKLATRLKTRSERCP